MGPGGAAPLATRVQTGHGIVAGEAGMVPVIGCTFTLDGGATADVAVPTEVAAHFLAALLSAYGLSRGETGQDGDVHQLAQILERSTFADLIRRLA